MIDRDVQLDLTLEEAAGVETVCPSGESYAWTRKQGGIRAHGRIVIDGEPRLLDSRRSIDDTAAYYERHTRWRWSAGVGTAPDGRAVAWNLVAGVNDPPTGSERTVWLDGEPREVGPATFSADLTAVDGLRFHPEAVRERQRQPGPDPQPLPPAVRQVRRRARPVGPGSPRATAYGSSRRVVVSAEGRQ